jgi:hypothetical protein
MKGNERVSPVSPDQTRKANIVRQYLTALAYVSALDEEGSNTSGLQAAISRLSVMGQRIKRQLGVEVPDPHDLAKFHRSIKP